MNDNMTKEDLKKEIEDMHQFILDDAKPEEVSKRINVMVNWAENLPIEKQEYFKDELAEIRMTLHIFTLAVFFAKAFKNA